MLQNDKFVQYAFEQLVDDGVGVVCQVHMPRQWHLQVMPGCNDAPAATGDAVHNGLHAGVAYEGIGFLVRFWESKSRFTD